MEEDINTYLAMIEAYREQLEAIDAQSAYIQALINDYVKAKITIENLEKEGKKDVLLPIGGGIFIPAKCDKVTEVLVSEGADIVIKKNLKDAKESLDSKVKDLQDSLKRLGESYQKIQARMEEISQKVREIMEKKG